MRWIDVEVSHHWSGCVDGNVIGVFDQLDVRRRSCKVGQIVIEVPWRLNSTLYHSCFHLSACRFVFPNMTFGSSVLHIVTEPATDFCRYVGVVGTMGQLMMVRIVELGRWAQLINGARVHSYVVVLARFYDREDYRFVPCFRHLSS